MQDRAASLALIKTVHTVVWAFFAGCVLAIPIASLLGEHRVAAWLSGIVFLEVLVLLFNRMRCPLTTMAEQFMDERRDNFDIYLPERLARNNKLLFGTLYVAGVLFAAARWISHS
jgi:hypothetical protein